MNSLVVLFSVLAVTAVRGYGVASVLPTTSSVSQYSSSVVHGTPLYSAPAVYGASVYGPAVARAAVLPAVTPLLQAPVGLNSLYGIHALKKRSLGALSYSAPLAYSTPVVSAYSTPLVSAYSSPLVSSYATAPVVSTPLLHAPVAVNSLYGVHSLKKRSLGALSYLTPLAYSTSLVSAYSTPLVSSYASPVVSAYSSPVVASPLAYSAAVPRALSVHPY